MSSSQVVNGSHERHESVILARDEGVRRSVRETLGQTLHECKDREFNRSRQGHSLRLR